MLKSSYGYLIVDIKRALKILMVYKLVDFLYILIGGYGFGILLALHFQNQGLA